MNKFTFKYAHELTKLFLADFPQADYRATFGECLKEIYRYIRKNEKYVILYTQNHIERWGHILEDARFETVRKSDVISKEFVRRAFFSLKDNLPSEIQKWEKEAIGAAKFYKGQSVTMC